MPVLVYRHAAGAPRLGLVLSYVLANTHMESNGHANFLLYVAVLVALAPKHLHSSIGISPRVACRRI